ncbi:hypothetical protein IT411_00960, partial [Candidatus Peregrinibacteria bacterium]|nr:hypothetical protein [Candidatus Peregrinibacteria bacterium]
FAQELGKSLLNWQEKESLVLAIYGEWGSGKSSIINLAKKCIESSTNQAKPTVIEFNPWLFSDLDSLSENFFAELGKQLKVKGASDNDKKIAEKLAYYAAILNLMPEKESISGLINKVIIGAGIFGISLPQILQYFNFQQSWVTTLFFVGGFILLITQLSQSCLSKLSDIFEKRSIYKEKSVIEIKEEIKQELRLREAKLLIVIDDIDRLNRTEIREIFRLIRANADFPNTIYLLSFDRGIIEANLEEQAGISGKDYLEKIVQVNFDVPYAKPNKIQKFLFEQLDRILDLLPEKAKSFFGEDEPYWTNVYYSGLKDFFKNIRDVKRFISGLEFNITQIHQNDVLEVNPIDFIAIEAIRIFVPEFYDFMKSRNELFTSTEGESGSRDANPRKKELEKAFEGCESLYRDSTVGLVKRLFPQVDGIMEHGYSSHGPDWQPSWSKQLRVCATKNFDSYFTLIPGGDEAELSQFEIEEILESIKTENKFEELLRTYIGNKKIRKVLQRLQDYTDDDGKLPFSSAETIVLALFNISDDLPPEVTGMFDMGSDMEIMRIIYQLFKRQKDKVKNFEVLKKVIPLSKGLFGPVEEISLESPREGKERSEENLSLPKENIPELQKLSLAKIEEFKDRLLDHEKFLYILYRWKEWDAEEKYKTYIEEILKDENQLFKFLQHFISKSKSTTMGDYGSRTRKTFNYKSLRDFVELDFLKDSILSIKASNDELYKLYQESVDLFLNNFDKQDRQDDLF